MASRTSSTRSSGRRPSLFLRYVFGEQDFLKAFWGGEHAQLSRHYHCFAEEFGVARRLGGAALVAAGGAAGARGAAGERDDDADDDRDGATLECAVAEFMSCGASPWKPWHGAAAFDAEGFKVCFHAPSEPLRALLARWERARDRALAHLRTRGFDVDLEDWAEDDEPPISEPAVASFDV